MSVWPVPPDHPITVTRRLDDERRSQPRLTVPFEDLFDFHMAPSYPPGRPDRLAAWIRAGAREWSGDVDEEVLVDPVMNSSRLLSALGHRVEGHACADCCSGDELKL